MNSELGRTLNRGVLCWSLIGGLAGCGPKAVSVSQAPASQPSPVPATAPAFDTTAARPIQPRDWLERWALERGADFKLIDSLMDPITAPPPFDREPAPALPAQATITDGVPVLNDVDPFPAPLPLPHKEVTIRSGAARSTYRTRTRQEVLSSLAPLFDLIQREVNVRTSTILYENPKEIYFGLLDGKTQTIISHVFDYLLVRSWLASQEGKRAIPLSWSQAANLPMRTDEEGGKPGHSVLLVVARDAPYRSAADLKGTRLALTANYTYAPGTFVTEVLMGLGHPLDKPFFSKVTLRRYTKDTVIDVIKGKADVACVDEGTVAALDRFYGVAQQVRTLATSPRYDLDVLYTSENNAATYRAEIELTQTQVTTLGKNPEGQEVLFLFDTQAWHNFCTDDFAVAEEHFANFLKFLSQTPVDLKPLLDPHAAIDARTYDRYGDE